ncbi:hypothetical protein F0562_001510 [Nyssa sinensis]|uniref:Leucine-rich repeat-containing N-terminal plant-type domain-containing protein n=1 Tax=Nyssa sinensis TaxID=561372 RepID=A0A5J5C4C8_9ASTE|nr:hypothetical protein F0562_001510 [Nyssa sinensis]
MDLLVEVVTANGLKVTGGRRGRIILGRKRGVIQGIACDQNGRVTHLDLPGRHLAGGISPFLGNLTHLTHLNLSHNWLSGPLPYGLFSSLNRLNVLDLSFNSLSAELPSSLSSDIQPLPIQIVDLSSNHFNGTIQSSFLQLASNLIYFNVSNNTFTGPIPSSIRIKSHLIQLFDFSYNDFTGQIPVGLGGCSQLEVFRAGFNLLSGLLPYDFYNATALREISLPSNQLSGPIGNGIVHLSNLTILVLHSNELSGELPRDIGELCKLEQLHLARNRLNGSVPHSLMNCTSLMMLNLCVNHLEGNISTLNLSKLRQLRKLDFGYNNFTGNLPRTLYSCKSLVAIRFAGNSLEGQILPEMLALQSLSFLSFAANKLSNISGAIKILMGCRNLSVAFLSYSFKDETMPDDDNTSTFDGFQNLKALVISHSQLSGQVPSWLAKLTKLELLDLSVNQLIGSIPSWLGTLSHLFYIDLSHNLLSGEFPHEVCELPGLTSKQVGAERDQSYLELPLFAQPANATNLMYNRLSNIRPSIILSNNSLSGKIPTEIGQLLLLHVLDLSYNNFSGPIPNHISYLTNLEKLYLSGNHLSGMIPASLGSLSFLSSFSVADNNLQGPIPSGTQLQSFPASEYMGNPELCGLPLPNRCRSTTRDREHKNIPEEEDGHEIPQFYVSAGFGYVTGFLVVCGTLLFHNSWRRAYFQFLNDVKDQVYVIIVVNVATLWRRL